MTLLKSTSIILIVLLAAGFGFIYSGAFNIAADNSHWTLTQRLIETTRERSIAIRAHDIKPIALDDPALLTMGAEHYSEMCTGCHLAPGMQGSEIRAGLNPKPPNLTGHGTQRSSAETFWIIKHGLKMTGMPAWGVTHDDRSIWALVAFVQKLPTLSQSQYEGLITQGDAAGHTHNDHEESDRSHEDSAAGAKTGTGPKTHEHTHSDDYSHSH